MLCADLFDEAGNLMVSEKTHCQPHSDATAEVASFSSHFYVPTEILMRVSKNKGELALIQRLGELSLAVEQNLHRLSSPSAQNSSEAKSLSLGLPSSEIAISGDSNEIRPRDASHQPLEDSTLFGEISASSGQAVASMPESGAFRDRQENHSWEEGVLEAVVAIGSAVDEIEKTKTELERYLAGNAALVEELLDQNCPELLEQKKLLIECEKFILERVEMLKNGWQIDGVLAPWSK